MIVLILLLIAIILLFGAAATRNAIAMVFAFLAITVVAVLVWRNLAVIALATGIAVFAGAVLLAWWARRTGTLDARSLPARKVWEMHKETITTRFSEAQRAEVEVMLAAKDGAGLMALIEAESASWREAMAKEPIRAAATRLTIGRNDAAGFERNP